LVEVQSLRRSIWAVLLGVLFAITAAESQQPATPQVRAYLDPSQSLTDAQAVRYVIEISGGSSQEVRQPSLPKLENFTVVGGPQISTSWVSVNGRASMTYKMIWTLFPDGPGKARVPSIEFELAGRTHRTQPVEVTIASAASGSGSAPGTTQAQTDTEEVRLRAELADSEVWVGEPIPLTVTLYAIPRVTQFAFHKEPELAKFWVEEIPTDPSTDNRPVRIAGRVYRAYPVLRKILIPPGPGEYPIEPFIGQVTVMRSRDSFDWFRFGRSESELHRTSALQVTVRPLPTAGRPEDFGGAVGSYTMQTTLDRAEATVDDAVALRVTVEGEGALRTARPPAFEAPPDLRVFDPQVKESTVETRSGKVYSKKTWEWIVVPLSPGDVTLPELRFDYFDPLSGSYATAQGDTLALTVKRGEGSDEVFGTRRPVQLTRRELEFIKPLRGELRERSARVHDRGLFRMLVILPLLATPLLILLGRHQARLQRDQGLARGRRARRVARKRFGGARRRMAQLDSAAFHEEVARTLVEYIGDRFDRAASGMTYEIADNLLTSRDVDPELRRRYRACLESCDFARFVPASSATERRGELLADAIAIVDALEREL
jgi:hypothetical protein